MTPFWRSLGPAVPPAIWPEAVRAAVGAGLGLVLADLILWALAGGEALLSQPLLIAPFGASAFLIFAVPNSPLAQPWSAVVGNTLSCLAALAVLQTGLPVVPAIGAAVLLAVLAMAAARALHPPGGAVAIATVLAAPGPEFALMPVAIGTLALIVGGILWAGATGRRYPFRQPAAAPAQRQTPGPLALAAALANLRMGANLGVADLSRLIVAAEAASAAQSAGPMTADRVMTRDLVTLQTTDSLFHAAALFRQHGHRHLPLLEGDRFLGLIPQTALLGPLPDLNLPDLDLTALADRSTRSLPPEAPLADLVALLAQGSQICIPVTRNDRLLGLITRSDLLTALLHGTPRKDPT